MAPFGAGGETATRSATAVVAAICGRYGFASLVSLSSADSPPDRHPFAHQQRPRPHHRTVSAV